MASAAFAALIVFANSLANGFVLDDRGVVLDNPLVTSPLTAWRAFGLPYWPETIGGGQYRPLGILSFALDWASSGGDTRWFDAVNVMWHVAGTVLVWLLAAELLAPVAAADLAQCRQRPAVAAALRDSARMARTIPYRSTSFGGGGRQ